MSAQSSVLIGDRSEQNYAAVRKEMERIKAALEGVHKENARWLRKNKFGEGLVGCYPFTGELLESLGEGERYSSIGRIGYKGLKGTFEYNRHAVLYEDGTLVAMVTGINEGVPLSPRCYTKYDDFFAEASKKADAVKKSFAQQLLAAQKEVKRKTGVKTTFNLSLTASQPLHIDLVVGRSNTSAKEAFKRLFNAHSRLAQPGILLSEEEARKYYNNQHDFDCLFKDGRWQPAD